MIGDTDKQTQFNKSVYSPLKRTRSFVKRTRSFKKTLNFLKTPRSFGVAMGTTANKTSLIAHPNKVCEICLHT